MNLTPQQKQKIYEKEKVRLEAQNKIKQEKKNTEAKQGCLIFIVIIILLTLFHSCGSPKETPDSQPAVNQSENQEIKRTYSLGLTPDQFKNKFNQTALKWSADLNIDQLKIEEGTSQNAFKYMFNNILGIRGSVNKNDGSIRDISIIGALGKDVHSNLELLAAMGIVIEIINPELSAAQRGELMHDLGFKEDTDLTKLNEKATRGNKNYYCSFIKDIGFMFSVSDVNDGN